ncbi:hypothetical protein C8J56DRAFT_891942 [Mycena floridula]|nr:hypothetical protein C8J56DRAFT_891942 [Mycena floridula]
MPQCKGRVLPSILFCFLAQSEGRNRPGQGGPSRDKGGFGRPQIPLCIVIDHNTTIQTSHSWPGRAVAKTGPGSWFVNSKRDYQPTYAWKAELDLLVGREDGSQVAKKCFRKAGKHERLCCRDERTCRFGIEKTVDGDETQPGNEEDMVIERNNGLLRVLAAAFLFSSAFLSVDTWWTSLLDLSTKVKPQPNDDSTVGESSRDAPIDKCTGQEISSKAAVDRENGTSRKRKRSHSERTRRLDKDGQW